MGLEKLATTESSVADMQGELIALQPQLDKSTKETEAAMVVRAASILVHFKPSKLATSTPMILPRP